METIGLIFAFVALAFVFDQQSKIKKLEKRVIELEERE